MSYYLDLFCFHKGVLNGKGNRSLHSPPVAFEEIERRVSGPLPLSRSQNRSSSSTGHDKNPSCIFSEPPTHDGSLPEDTADLIARPISSSSLSVPYRHKTLPPINPQQQRRNSNVPLSNKAEQLIQNQQRIARLIKHIK